MSLEKYLTLDYWKSGLGRVHGGGIASLSTVSILGHNWEINTLLLVIAIVLFVWVLVALVVYEHIKAKKSAEHLEKSFTDQADQQILNTRPHKRGEIKRLKREFLKAVKILNESKLGKSGNAQSALYKLPWFMLIGKPGAGKSTALLKSGLRFPYGKPQLGGLGGTKNCEWFFSDAGIFLDTAGRYTVPQQQSDEAEWTEFLKLLNRHRREQPINGVILTVSLEDLLREDEEALEKHAFRMRRRIDELIRKLKFDFPVFLLFTKCDLIPGFTTFFGDLNGDEQQQVWGCSFPKKVWASHPPAVVFREEYNRLYRVLLERRFSRMDGNIKGHLPGKIYRFPLHFQKLQEKLVYFTDKLFQPNEYQETPFFRGFYFTSGTQPVAQTNPEEAEWAADGSEGGTVPLDQPKSFFLRELFTRVIVGAQKLARPLAPPRLTTKERVIIGGLTVILFFFVLSASRSFMQSKHQLESIQQNALALQARHLDGHLEENYFRQLDQLRSQIEVMAAGVGWSWGYQRSAEMHLPARLLFHEKFRPFVRQFLLPALKGQSNGQQVLALLNLELQELTKSTQRSLLKDELLIVLRQQAIPTDLRRLLERQIAFFVDNLGVLLAANINSREKLRTE